MKLLKIFLLACMVMVTGIYGAEGSQSNILWHNSTTGAVKIIPINEMNPAPDLSVVDSSNVNLVPRGMGDFTGEGNPDILFHNQNSGNLRIWKMNGAAKVDNIQILGSSNTNLKIAGVGDFDGDGDNDIATFNTNSGALRIWVMDGTVRVDNVLVLTGANTNLVPRGVGDMDGDRIPDIVLRNNNSGAVRVWTMNEDFTRKGNEYVTGSSNTNLELRGVVDINGDGNNDILNYNTNTGKLRAWLMDGNLKITENASIVQESDLEWSVRGGSEIEFPLPHIEQDIDNDGVPDYLDAYPANSSKSAMPITVESEFNNNMEVANDIYNNKTFPFAISAKLEKGSNYYLDSDYFKISAKKGQRISLLVFPGEATSYPLVHMENTGICSLKANILNSEGLKISGKIFSVFNNAINGLGIEILEDGDYYIVMSDSTLVASDYSCPYTIIGVNDIDFDGVSDQLENIVRSNSENADTDEDRIDDFSEIYPFILKFHGINQDAIQASAVKWWDADNDGVVNWHDEDSDGDGMLDRLEQIIDFDNDLIPNFIDSDSNGDGISDQDQSGGSYQYPVDSDSDGLPDFIDLDIDNDSIPNTIDPDTKKAQEANDINAQDSIYLQFVEAVIDSDTIIRDLVIAERELRIYGRGISGNYQVLFPVAGGSKAVQSQSNSDGLLTVMVPKDVIDGSIHLFDGEKLSNGLYVEVQQIDSSPIIYSVDPDTVSPGEKITISGVNLSNNQTAVVFKNNNGEVRASAVSQGKSVQVTVPSKAKSGTVHLEIVTGLSTNALPLSIQKTISVNVALSASSPFNYTQLSLLANGQDIALDSSYRAKVNVENQAIDYLASFVDIDGEVGLLYESVVLPDDVAVELSALSTAAKWVFFGLQYSRSQPQEKWKDIIEIIKSTQETITLAAYIDVLLEWDHMELSWFNDDVFLITTLQEAQTASANAVNTAINVSTVSQNKVLSANPVASATSISSEILPKNPQSDVYIETDNDANINIINHNNLFLSVKATTEGGTKLSKHIDDPYDTDSDHGFIGATGWVFNTDKKLLSQGEDTHLEVVTGGVGGYDTLSPDQQLVHVYLWQRVIIDGMLFPLLDASVKRILPKGDAGLNGRALVDLVGPKQWSILFKSLESNPDNFHNFLFDEMWKVIWNKGFLACYQDAVGDSCQRFAKVIGITPERIGNAMLSTIGQKAAAYLVPYVGQIKAAYDNIGLIKTGTGVVLTIKDFYFLDKKIDFDVKFGLVINSVGPQCITNNPEINRFMVDRFLISALGITPAKQYIWWGEYTNPKVEISGRELKILSISEPQERIKYMQTQTALHEVGMKYFRLITAVLSDEDKLEIGDGMKYLTLTDKDEKVQYVEPLEFAITSLSLNTLWPSAALRGHEIILRGCGFSNKIYMNDVYFTCDITDCPNGRQKAVVLEGNEKFLKAIVPQDAITGDVFVLAKFGYGSRIIASNSLKFTLSDVIDPCSWSTKPAPEYCSMQGESGILTKVDTNDDPNDDTYAGCSYYNEDWGAYSGTLHMESPYVDGLDHGRVKFYLEGELSGCMLFERGILIDTCPV